MKSEIRSHLGPGEIEIDSPLYGIMLVGNGTVMMTVKVYDDKAKAIKELDRFKSSQAYVVTIGGTNEDQ